MKVFTAKDRNSNLLVPIQIEQKSQRVTRDMKVSTAKDRNSNLLVLIQIERKSQCVTRDMKVSTGKSYAPEILQIQICKFVGTNSN